MTDFRSVTNLVHDFSDVAGAATAAGSAAKAAIDIAGGSARRSVGDGSHLGVVDDIFVEEGARGIGVGELMMGELVSWCRARGCFGIDVMALPGHRAAKNFFEESGFTARKIVMHHRLVEP